MSIWHDEPPAGPALDRGYPLHWNQRRSGPLPFEPVADPLSSRLREATRLGRPPSLQLGMVVDAVGQFHAYRVVLGDGHPPLVCTYGGDHAGDGLGLRSAVTLSIGTTVVVAPIGPPGTGVILAVVPAPAASSATRLADYAHLAGRCGLRVDPYHAKPLTMAAKGLVRDWSGGGPADALTGEWGVFSDTGMRVWLDGKMAALAADEFTGLWVFYRDQLARLGGMNLQVFSSGRDREELDDEGEFSSYDGTSTYAHEALGLFAPGDPFREVPPQEYQQSNPALAPLEPKDPDQQAFHRVIELGGYLGQGKRTWVQAPPIGGDTFRYAPGQRPVAVHEEHATMGGKHLLRAARGIHIRRSGAIPAPVRVRRPEDPQGDNKNNYRAAGLFGSGPSHAFKPDLQVTGEYPGVRRIAAIEDVHALAFNMEGLNALRRHTRDWEVPDETATPVGQGARPVDFAKLAGSPFVDPPDPVSVKIDDRYGSVAVYPNACGIDLLEDGGVAISDGFGAQIRMTGGSIFIDAPGDIVLRAGRNVISMAGRDVVGRAHGSVELSAAHKAVRIKAETDVEVLAGNGGEKGAVLIESRALGQFDVEGKPGDERTAGGVILRAPHGPVAAVGHSVYLRTGKGEAEDGVDAGGLIALDAGAGRAPITTTSSTFTRYLLDSASDHFSEADPGTIRTSNYYGRDATIICSLLEVDGKLITTDGAVIANFVAVPGGHIFTELADQYFFQVTKLQDGGGAGKSLTDSQNAVTEVGDDIKETTDEATAFYAAAFTDGLYADASVGADGTLKAHEFGFRPEDQYKTKDWVFHEASWQRQARLAGMSLGAWSEPKVVSAGVDTMPWPGYDAWAKRETLVLQEAVLVDPATGLARAWTDGAYSNPTLGGDDQHVPNDKYLIIDPATE